MNVDGLQMAAGYTNEEEIWNMEDMKEALQEVDQEMPVRPTHKPRKRKHRSHGTKGIPFHLVLFGTFFSILKKHVLQF